MRSVFFRLVLDYTKSSLEQMTLHMADQIVLSGWFTNKMERIVAKHSLYLV